MPYDLLWLKKFAFLIIAFEHEIESIYPRHRAYDTQSRVNDFYKPPSRNPYLDPRAGPLEGIKIVETASSVEQLIGLFNAKDRQCAYNLLNMVETNSLLAKQTIEFRQHEGTLQPDAIINWVKFVCAMVRYCYYANINDMLLYCLGHLYSPVRLNVLHLLVEIKATELISFYRGRADLARETASQERMPAVQRYEGWGLSGLSGH